MGIRAAKLAGCPVRCADARRAKRAASGTRSEASRVPGERSEPHLAREATRAGRAYCR